MVLIVIALLWTTFIFFDYIRTTNIQIAQFGTGVYLTNNRNADYHDIKLVLDITYSRQEYTFNLGTLSSRDIPKVLYSQFVDDEGNAFNFSTYNPALVTLTVKIHWEKDIVIHSLATRRQTGIDVEKRGPGLYIENLDNAVWYNLDFTLNEEGSSRLYYYSVTKLANGGAIIISFSNFKDNECNQYEYDGIKNLELSVKGDSTVEGTKTFTFGIPSE